MAFIQKAENATLEAAHKTREKAHELAKRWVKGWIKKLGWGYLLEWTPAVGWLVPGDIMLVYRTLKGNLTSPEAILMFIIAGGAYLIKIAIGIVEVWFDLGFFTTLVTWCVASFFAFWLWMRGGAITGMKAEEKPPQKGPRNVSTNDKNTNRATIKK